MNIILGKKIFGLFLEVIPMYFMVVSQSQGTEFFFCWLMKLKKYALVCLIFLIYIIG